MTKDLHPDLAEVAAPLPEGEWWEWAQDDFGDFKLDHMSNAKQTPISSLDFGKTPELHEIAYRTRGYVKALAWLTPRKESGVSTRDGFRPSSRKRKGQPVPDHRNQPEPPTGRLERMVLGESASSLDRSGLGDEGEPRGFVVHHVNGITGEESRAWDPGRHPSTEVSIETADSFRSQSADLIVGRNNIVGALPPRLRIPLGFQPNPE